MPPGGLASFGALFWRLRRFRRSRARRTMPFLPVAGKEGLTHSECQGWMHCYPPASPILPCRSLHPVPPLQVDPCGGEGLGLVGLHALRQSSEMREDGVVWLFRFHDSPRMICKPGEAGNAAAAAAARCHYSAQPFFSRANLRASASTQRGSGPLSPSYWHL